MPAAVLPPPLHLPLGHGHRMAWYDTGPPDAPAVLLLHGGPGGSTRARSVAWFEGLGRRVVAFDQRGCGASTPLGETASNTLSDLVADMERLREHLGLSRWAVAGGSWGSLLGIAYTAAHPDRVEGLFLRSTFLGRRAEVTAFFKHWSDWLGPEGARWLDVPFPIDDPVHLLDARAPGRGDPSPLDEATARRHRRIAEAWGRYEAAQSLPGGWAARSGAGWAPPDTVPAAFPPSYEVQRHYLAHRCFVDDTTREAWLDTLARTSGPCPMELVHGSADAVCDVAVSRGLAERWPQASLEIVEGAGHAMDHPGLEAALREAARRWIGRLDG